MTVGDELQGVLAGAVPMTWDEGLPRSPHPSPRG